jgi:hypothetical protein
MTRLHSFAFCCEGTYVDCVVCWRDQLYVLGFSLEGVIGQAYPLRTRAVCPYIVYVGLQVRIVIGGSNLWVVYEAWEASIRYSCEPVAVTTPIQSRNAHKSWSQGWLS